MQALDSLIREFRVDQDRLYLVGVSMGGHGVWETLMRFPDRFAAAVPICASGDTAGLQKIKAVPIWCFHGGADTTVPVSYARRMMAALRQAGGKPKYTEYPGVGHDSYRNAFREEGLLPWLFAQHRK
jgi:predicted peptidase